VEAVVWSDYLCPWCYVGRDRTAGIELLGVHAVSAPYELHPEIPPEGRPIRADGRIAQVFDRIEAECDAAGRPFRRPTRVPNTRRALETAEVVRERSPLTFGALDDALFRAYFVEDLPLDDHDLLDELVAGAGASADEVRQSVEAGDGHAAVNASMRRAHGAGVTATPAWLIDGRFVIPGVQPFETMQRWILRLQTSSADQHRPDATSIDQPSSEAPSR